MSKSHCIRCWQFGRAPDQVQALFLGRKSTRRPRAQDWVLEVWPNAKVPEEVLRAVVVAVQTGRADIAGNARLFFLVPGSAESRRSSAA